jgi:phosphoribosyl-AMP cyclohydrolase
MSDELAVLDLDFGPDGLVPAVIQDATTNAVLMVGFMNEAALARTRGTGLVHFWSRSRSKLWQKGETSGHVQHVQEIFVNCEENSLLISVDQVGAVCHTGYPTCFYRRLEVDGTLSAVQDRWFDPADVYGGGLGLAGTTRSWWEAFEYLRDHDSIAESNTSQLLHATGDGITARLVAELAELAGVLDGTHRHEDETSDAALEGGQIFYWLAIRNVWAGSTWDDIRPDRALDAPASEDVPSKLTLAALIRVTARRWTLPEAPEHVEELAYETFALVSACMVRMGVTPRDLIEADLDSLRQRLYLKGHFGVSHAANHPESTDGQTTS